MNEVMSTPFQVGQNQIILRKYKKQWRRFFSHKTFLIYLSLFVHKNVGEKKCHTRQ
jgi:hypothetical protein